MICIYEKTETSFTYNGLGTLEPLECFFSSEINGVWQLEMYVPYDPEGKSKLIANDRILKVTDIDCIQEQTSDYQLFRIYDYRKEGSNIYVLAYPIGLDARFDTYTNSLQCNYKTAAQAISQINNVSNKYTVSTDITSSTLKSAQWNHSNIISMLNTDEEGFVQKWGGEICYDNYNIKVNNSLGRSSGASEVRYGKNIRGMSFEEDISNVITRLYPIANSGEVLNGVSAYKIANNQYVDASNASDYPIPHINYVEAPYNLVQMSNDGSANYTASYAAYETIRDATANWLNDALLGENTGGVDGLLLSMELGWLVDNYALTMANDGTQGLVEYITDNIANDSNNPILSSAVKSLIYSAIKAGFDLVLKDDSSAVYVGASSKKMWDAPQSQHFYSYTWDSAGDYRVNKNGDAEYAWVYASSKWQQLDDEGITTGTVDSATWKWYKVTGKKYKRYGNKKKKRFLNDQWWKINDIWYWFDGNGEGDYGASLQANCYDMVDSMLVSSKTIYALLSPICKNAESQLFFLLYNQMTDYCTNLFVTEKMSYPTPSISIDMVDLSRTEEYKNYSNLLKIKLGDTIKCLNSKLNIVTDLRVTSLTYDVLRKYNSAIQIGMTENSIISAFDKYGRISDETLAKQGLIAGNGIMIQGNVISAVGQKITDVFVNGHSVTYGGKAYIDLDEIGGEGLQWFEETEDALFGYSTELALTDDNAYKISTAGNSITMSNSQTGETLDVAVSGDDSTLLIYYPYAYFSKASNIISGINVGNYGNALVLSKSSFSVLTTIHPASGSVSPTVYASFNSSSSDGWKAGYIINPETGEHEYGYSGPITFHGNAQVNGETWYMVMIGYNYQFTMSNTNRSLINYLPVAQYPNGDVTDDAAYETVADLIQATVPLTRSTEGGSFNGISREGNLAFFAGADDEHGLNAPIKIYKDGTYEGLDKVEDVKVDGTSVVTSKIANINTMTGATSGASGTKGLVPRPLSADRTKFLKGDGTWDTPDGGADMQGATAQANGVHGLVPQPLIANKDQFLKGDGTWATPTDTQYSDFDGTTHGLVPAPSSGDSGYLKVDGTWESPTGASDMTGATSQADGSHGLVPQPLIANREQFLKGDGTWATPTDTQYSDFSGSTHGLVPAVSTQADKFLKDDGSWDIPTNTTYSDFDGTNHGLVPAPSGASGYLKSDGTWATPSGGASALNDLTDVTISSPTNNQVLKYDSANSKWINASESGGTTVVANPSGTATTDLEKLQVGNVIYSIPSGSGGSGDIDYIDINLLDYTTAPTISANGKGLRQIYIPKSAYAGKKLIPCAANTKVSSTNYLTDIYFFEETTYDNVDYWRVGILIYNNSTDSITPTQMHLYVADISDISGGGGGSGGGINYSTTEQDTGLTWIDGRPIYQKTYYISSMYSGEIVYADQNMTASTIDNIWIMQETSTYEYGGNTVRVGGQIGGAYGISYCEVYGANGLAFTNSLGIGISDVYFTVQYTKIADL